MNTTLYVATREEWRAWLAEHHATASEVWLIFYKKQSGQPRVRYDAAVEEALCFGWIDSIVKTLDEDRYAQRFTPRRPGSNWSASNRARVRRLIAAGQMAPAGLARLEFALEDPPAAITEETNAPGAARPEIEER